MRASTGQSLLMVILTHHDQDVKTHLKLTIDGHLKPTIDGHSHSPWSRRENSSTAQEGVGSITFGRHVNFPTEKDLEFWRRELSLVYVWVKSGKGGWGDLPLGFWLFLGKVSSFSLGHSPRVFNISPESYDLTQQLNNAKDTGEEKKAWNAWTQQLLPYASASTRSCPSPSLLSKVAARRISTCKQWRRACMLQSRGALIRKSMNIELESELRDFRWLKLVFASQLLRAVVLGWGEYQKYAEFNKEQIGTLFVWVEVLEGGFGGSVGGWKKGGSVGGWSLRGVHPQKQKSLPKLEIKHPPVELLIL